MYLTPVTSFFFSISIIMAAFLIPQIAHADGNPPDDYIKVEVRGKLNNEIMAIGGETTGVIITANGVTWELDFSDAPNSQKKSKPMNGKIVVIKGELSVKRGVEIPQRWIVKVDSIESGSTSGSASLLDTGSDQVKKLQVSQTFGGYRETQIFFTFPKKNVILKVRIDNKTKDFAATGKILVFPKSTTAEGLAKWLNNQHSDGLYPDIPLPVSTLDIPTKFCSSTNPKYIDQAKSHLGNFDKYSIEYAVKDVERIGDFQIKGFSGKAMVYLKDK
ncbi:hypothetical protein N9066_00080 [bacterium]|nr:hypothetical protein [bacterium]